MANNLSSNVSSMVLKKFAPAFMSNSVLLRTVDRQIIKGEIDPNTGDSVFLKRPHYSNVMRTANGDLTGKSADPFTSGKILAKISSYATVYKSWTQLEEAIELNQLDKFLESVAGDLNVELEKELAKYIIANSSLSLGIPGKSIKNWGDVAQVGSMLSDIGAPAGAMYGVMSPWAAQNLAEKQSGLDNGDLVRTAWERAQIPGNFAGISALMSNGLASRVCGSACGAASVTVKTAVPLKYADVKDTMTMTVTLTGASLSGKELKAGDQVSFDTIYWVNQRNKETMYGADDAPIKFTATVLEDATAAGDDITVKLSSAAIHVTADADQPQYNTASKAVAAGDAVTVIGTADASVRPSLFYHEQAIAMGSVVLPALHGKDSSVMTSEQGGLSIRVTKDADTVSNKQYVRFDILPTFSMLDARLAGQFFGNS